MIEPDPQNFARLDVDWDADARSSAQAAYDAQIKDLCEYKEEEPREDDGRSDEAQREEEDRRARDARTDARCKRLGLIVAKRMPVIHQRRVARDGRR